MTNKKAILIYGSRDFSAIVRSLIASCGLEYIGLIDDIYTDNSEIIGSFEKVINLYSPEQYEIVLAIGYNNLNSRNIIYEKIKDKGYSLPKLIHPNAIVHESAQISDGAILMAGAIVDINAKIGSISVLWPGVIVNHDSVIGSNTFLSPGANICGFCSIGNNSFIGAGAIVTDHVSVSNNCFIKAGEIFHNRSNFKKNKS